MADPFSIFSGTVGLLDVCVRLTKYLRRVHSASKEIEQDLNALINEVDSLKDVDQLIQNLWLQHGKSFAVDDPTNSHIVSQWAALRVSLKHCTSSIVTLEKSVDDVVGPEGLKVQGKVDAIKKTIRKQSKEEDLRGFRTRVMSHRDNLNLLLQVIQLSYSQTHQESIGRGLTNVSDEVRQQGFRLQQTLSVLVARTEYMDTEHFRDSVTEASRAVSSIKLNEHFYLPKAVNSLYVGRESMLKTLKKALLEAHSSSQRRFVICGYGGSGKTELASKFAQDNRSRFWAIFSINGSNEETIRHGFATIARTAQLGDDTYAAGKHWLANLQLPWLLIIDNADDVELDLSQHFPAGEYGVVVITTRVSRLQNLGTVNPGFFDLGQERLSRGESNELLLRAAHEIKRSESIWEAATRIAKHLGYLPLALIHAGCAILKGMGRCTLFNYIEVYNRSWNYIRKRKSLDGTKGLMGEEGLVTMKVFSTIEIPFRGLQHTKTLPAQDAIQLLKLFSFFSGDNIRFDILTTAVTHVLKQNTHEEQQAAAETAHPKELWRSFLTQAFLTYISLIDKSAPTLPSVLRVEQYDDMRLTEALDKLETLALINSNDNGSYSMHPLVHLYVREQPDMPTAEQALWCDVASSVLSQSILMPPLDSIESSEALKGHLLPHINHVLGHRKKIADRLAENRKRRRLPWKQVLEPTSTKQLAIERIKFSLIYFKNGRLEEAANLQLQVLDYVLARYGENNDAAWRVKSFLSHTYGLQTKHNQAAELQVSVFNSISRTLGKKHIRTLQSMSLLGSTRAFQTRFRESKDLLEETIQALEKLVKTSVDECFVAAVQDEIYIAKWRLGGTMFHYFEFVKCNQLHREAYRGLSRSQSYGAKHPQTLDAQEDLAVSYTDVENGDLDFALQLGLDAKRQRKHQCGTQHPLTLKSRLWLARVRIGRGESGKAEKMFHKHLPVAEKSLGSTHLGILAGHMYLAHALARQQKYAEAEEEFLYVTKRELYLSSARADGDHGDRLNALRYMLRMYVDWGKSREALDVCDQIYDAASKVGGKGYGLQHKIIPWIEEIQKDIMSKHHRIDSGFSMAGEGRNQSIGEIFSDSE